MRASLLFVFFFLVVLQVVVFPIILFIDCQRSHAIYLKMIDLKNMKALLFFLFIPVLFLEVVVFPFLIFVDTQWFHCYTRLKLVCMLITKKDI